MADQQLESGIWIPDRDPDKGYPFVQVILDSYPGCVINIAGPEESDVTRWAARLEDARRAFEAGQDIGPLDFVEPAYGETCYIAPPSLQHVALVTRGFMAKVAVEAMKNQHGLSRTAKGAGENGSRILPVRTAPADPFRAN